MSAVLATQSELPRINDIQKFLSPYQRADDVRSRRQLAVTLALYLASWALMYLSLSLSYALTLLLALPTAGLMVRLFIFFHDCGHNSFFRSTRTNRLVGFWLGILVFTPSEQWWHAHAIHHATSGNLDKRGVGDVTTLTVAEYRALPTWRKIGYRLYRHPLVMFGLGPLYMFLISHRLPQPHFGRKETLNVVWTNLALLILITLLSLLIGLRAYLLIQLPVLWLAGFAGIWLFYIQHQFDGTYWAHSTQWNYLASALRGASYYELPKALEWFSGAIGYHQIHHLNPRIPNYYLRLCYQHSPLIQQYSQKIRLGEGIKTLGLALWDEEHQRLVRFRDLKPS